MRAIERNPKQPDFNRYEMLARHMEVGSIARMPNVTKHVAEEQRQDAQVLKQQRLAREETEALTKNDNKKQKGKGDPKGDD